MSQKDSSNIFSLKPSYLFAGTLLAGFLLIVLTGNNITFNVLSMIAIMAFYIYFIYNNENVSISKEQKADSCYYLGFILTLIAMINTLISLDVDNIDTIFNSVVRDFGLALVTTLVGLVARIIWLQLASRNAFDAISYKVADNSLGISSVLERLFKFPDRGAETLSASAANVVNAPVIL